MDMLAGAAFPLMLMIILSVSFIGMSAAFTDDKLLGIVLLCIGEGLLAASYVIFGRQNGVSSVRKLARNAKKREMQKEDRQTRFKTGEYSAYKGFVIALISCVPYIIIQVIECCAHNTFCDFLLQYAFGWAACPFTYMDASGWLNLTLVPALVAVHGVAYIWGGHSEWQKQLKIAELEKTADKKGKKRQKEG